jgi:hypothetical protein
MPDDIDKKSGDSVRDMLDSKHLDARTPEGSSLHQHNATPNFVDIDVTEDASKNVALRLSGDPGAGGTDSHALGVTSRKLCSVVAKLAEWLLNDFPPWAACGALMGERLCGTDKGLGGGVCPLCIDEIWR